MGFSKGVCRDSRRALRLIAGALVALSVLLGIYVNANFLWFTVRGSEPVPVRVYQLVSDDGDLAKGRPPGRHCSGTPVTIPDKATVAGRERVKQKGKVRERAIRRTRVRRASRRCGGRDERDDCEAVSRADDAARRPVRRRPTRHASRGARQVQAAEAARILGATRLTLDFADRLIQDTVEARLEVARLIRSIDPATCLWPKGRESIRTIRR